MSDIVLDVPAHSSTVCLPYSLVPGMTFSSPLFLKAVSTIAKQQVASSSTQHKEKGNTPIDLTVEGAGKFTFLYTYISST